MTSVNFQQWIQHPETLNRDTLYELRNLLARYPYFQSLRLLYLKNLYILHDISFGGELRKAVLYIADRRQLFRLIEGDRYDVQARKKGVPLTEVLKDEPSVDRTLALIDAFLSTVPEEVTARTSFDYSMDYTSFLLEETPATEQPAEETPKLKGFELIDDFIEKSESDSPLCMKPLREEMPSSPTSSDELTEEETIKEEEEDDSCFTETLAKIYVKQQRYSKALEIIKKLSLKYPEKNVYFALCHTLHHYGPLWSIFALHYVHIVYITQLFPHCILSATVFPISTIFSPSFFSSAIFFSISIYCGFTFFYHYAALVVPSCTWLCFSSFLSLF